jgi:hypothetical protein
MLCQNCVSMHRHVGGYVYVYRYVCVCVCVSLHMYIIQSHFHVCKLPVYCGTGTVVRCGLWMAEKKCITYIQRVLQPALLRLAVSV